MGLLEEIFQAEMGARLNPNQPPPQPISYRNITPEQMFLAREALGQQAGPTSGMQTTSFAKPDRWSKVKEAFTPAWSLESQGVSLPPDISPKVPMVPAPNMWAMYGGSTPMGESWRDDVKQSYETEYAPYNYIDPIGTDIANLMTGTEASVETTPWDAISAALEVVPFAAPFKYTGKVAKPLVKPIAKPIIKRGGEFVKDVGELFSQMHPERVNPVRWAEPLADIARNIKEGRGIQEFKKWVDRPWLDVRVDPKAEKFFDLMSNIKGRITERYPNELPINTDELAGPSGYSVFTNPTVLKTGKRLSAELTRINDAITGITRKYRDQVKLEDIFTSKQRSSTLPASLVFDAGDNPIKGKMRVNIEGVGIYAGEGSMFNKGLGNSRKTWLEQFEETVGDYLSHPIEVNWMFYRDVVDELQSVAPKHPQLPKLISLRDNAYRLGTDLAQEIKPHMDRSKQIDVQWTKLSDLNARLHAQWNRMAADRITLPKRYTGIVEKTALPAIGLIPELGDIAEGALDWWNLGEQIATSDWTQRMSR